MLEVKDISLSIKKNKILEKIKFEVKDGEVVTIIGPSGAGKTTFLRCLNLLNKPTKGKIIFDDLVLNFPKVSKKQIFKVRNKTAMVFQQYALFENKTARENITEGLIVSRKINKTKSNEIADELLHEVGLYDKRNFYPSNLSGGQQQRIGIARALALNPDLILFDEPTSALDPELVGETLDLIKKIAKKRKNKSMVIVTHEMQFAHDVSDWVVFMEKGRIVDQGKPSEILENPTNERIKTFLDRVRYD